MPLREVLERLKAAGLGSIPGGGAEILVDRVRSALTRGKCMTDDGWRSCGYGTSLGASAPRP